MRMPPEDQTETGEDEEEEDEEEDGDEDDSLSNQPQANDAEEDEVVMSTDTFLDLLYLAARGNSQNGVDTSSESMNWDDYDGSLDSNNCSNGNSDCDCDNGDYSDGDYDDEEGDVEIILEEIRRISEALLGSTMSELVDAERRISLKSFDELAARDESLSSIMDEWDYEDPEVSENDDCNGVVERIQLFMRPSQRDNLAGNVLRDMTERSLALQRENCRSAGHRSSRQSNNTANPGNIYVVFFDPTKLGVFSKFTPKDNAKATPKVKKTVRMKKVPQRVRIDKDNVRRWSEDDEKEEIARLLKCGDWRPSVQAQPSRVARGPAAAGAGAGEGGGVAALSRMPFAVTLPVDAAAPGDVRVALHVNRVLVAEVTRSVRAASGASGAGARPGQKKRKEEGEELRGEPVLVRRWAVPDGVDVDSVRCFVGEGLLLVTTCPLPSGFAWPFASPPTLLGPPVRVASPCNFPL